MLSLPYGDIDSALRRNTSWSLVVRNPRRQRPARGSIERRFGFSALRKLLLLQSALWSTHPYG